MPIIVTNVGPSPEEWRSLWQKKAFAWLKNRRGYRDFELDSCLRHIESGTNLREAAIAAYWSVYLPKEEAYRLNDAQLQRIKNILISPLPTAEPSPHITTVAFVNLHLAGTLILSLLRPDCPVYTDSVREALETGLKASNVICDEIVIPSEDQESSWCEEQFEPDLYTFSSRLVSGVIYYEVALLRKGSDNYEEALSFMATANWLLHVTLGDIAALPHSGRGFDIQDAADIFEAIKRSPRDIKDWANVERACREFDEISWRSSQFEKNITVGEGEEIEGLVYWRIAATFANDQSRIFDPLSRVRTKSEIQREEAKKRLERDFFGDLWQEMDEKTQAILVGAEVEWEEGRLDNMVKDIRRMLERVLLSVFPLLKPTVTRGDNQLILTHMRKGLEDDQFLRKSIDGLRIGNGDKEWIKRNLPGFLKDVVHVRNYFEKTRDSPGEEHDPDENAERMKQAGSMRQQLLGIGCRGVLRRLLEVKRTARGKK